MVTAALTLCASCRHHERRRLSLLRFAAEVPARSAMGLPLGFGDGSHEKKQRQHLNRALVVVVVVFTCFDGTRVFVQPRRPLHQIQWPDTWDDSQRQRHWDSTSKWTESEKCRKNAAKSPQPSPHSSRLKTTHPQTWRR